MSQLSAYWDSLLEEVLGDAANTQESPKNESSEESQTTTYETQIDEFVRSCGDGKLVLVLGSGISSNFGLPRWNKLLYKLLQKKSISEKGMLEANTIESIFSTVSPIVIARFACHLAKENFNEVVREKLYDYDEIHQQNKDVKNSWLSSITQLCESKRVDSIITYNFDDILEQHFATKEIQFTSYDRNHLKIENNGLPIYHVHGFLQQHVAATEDTRIIFSEEDYHEQYHDPYSWNTLIQLDKYRTRPCLFIGTSLTDPNQRRLLELSKTYKISDSIKHYVLRGREGLVVESQISNLEQITLAKKYMEHFYNKFISRLQKEKDCVAKSQAEQILRAKKHIKRFCKRLDSILQGRRKQKALAEKYMERFYNKLDEDFGINTIWVDKFDEIPTILNKITEKFTSSK